MRNTGTGFVVLSHHSLLGYSAVITARVYPVHAMNAAQRQVAVDVWKFRSTGDVRAQFWACLALDRMA